jgi:hypothetical protein
MSQSLGKALTTSQDEALVAMPLFKEGIINQGGPADIMARRIAIPANGGGGEECPIDDNVDADQPVVTEAFVRIRTLDDGTEVPVLRVFVAGLDGIAETPAAFRNAVTANIHDGLRYNDPESTEEERFGIRIDRWGVPCAIQVADFDDSVEWGPWTAVDLTNLPDGYTCDGPIPPACE